MPKRAVLSLIILSLMLMAGCGSDDPVINISKSNGLANGGASSVFVINAASGSSSASILGFAAGSNGLTTPQLNLLMAPTFTPVGLSADASSLYILGYDSNTTSYNILVYNNALSLVRSITPPTCNVMAVVSGSIYCSSAANGIVQYPLNGTTPIRTITGAATGLNTASPISFAVDSTGAIYTVAPAAVGSTLSVFASTANGNVAPARTLTLPGFAYGVAVDSSQNIYVSQNPTGSAGVGYIAEYSPALTLLKTITPATTLSRQSVGGVQVDSAGNLYTPIARSNGTTFTYAIDAFPPSASGTVTAAAEITATALSASGYPIAIR